MKTKTQFYFSPPNDDGAFSDSFLFLLDLLESSSKSSAFSPPPRLTSSYSSSSSSFSLWRGMRSLVTPAALVTDILFLNHDSSILRQSPDPACGFSMMEQVMLCAVWPMENWIEPDTGQTTVREAYSCALEQGPLTWRERLKERVSESGRTLFFVVAHIKDDGRLENAICIN